MRKLIVLMIAAMLAMPVSSAFALRPKGDTEAAKPETQQPSIDFNMEDETPSVRSNSDGSPLIETQRSVEVPAPEPQSQMSPNQLKILTEIKAATQLENAQLQLEAIQLQRAEQRNQFIELTQPKQVVVETEKEPDVEAMKMARAFPMPGGNPQVVSILGGNKKALEATLLFPNGLRYEVHKGMLLEGGYRVVGVSSNGVTLEKNGFRLPMPLSSGTLQDNNNKPWDGGQEMGIPTRIDSSALTTPTMTVMQPNP